MKKNDFGVFEIVLPPRNGKPAIPHNSKIKVCKSDHVDKDKD
jgi:1,4-alpha-glucan branching enzyme